MTTKQPDQAGTPTPPWALEQGLVSEHELAAFFRVVRTLEDRAGVSLLPYQPKAANPDWLQAHIRHSLGMTRSDHHSSTSERTGQLMALGIPEPYAKKLAGLPDAIRRSLSLKGKPLP